MRKEARKLGDIASELEGAVKAETTNVIVIGNLLIEAKEQLEHGDWLPWLAENFDSSTSTASNYMGAAKFAAKFPTVGNLKLRLSAIYLPSTDDGMLFDQTVIKAVLKEAENTWITDDRVWEIDLAMRPKPQPPETDENVNEEAHEATDEEAYALIDGPPPDLPPAPQATDHDVILPPFDQAIKTLVTLQTKPLAKFAGTAHKPSDIRAVGDFLHCLAEAAEEPCSKRLFEEMRDD